MQAHEAEQKEIIQGRIDALFEFDVLLPWVEVAAMSEDEYGLILAMAETKWEAEQDKIDADRKDLEDAKRAEIKTECDKL